MKLLRTTDITTGAVDWGAVPFCEEPPEDLEKYRLKASDIVISRAGSVGVSYLLNEIRQDAVFASYLIRFCPLPPNDPRFVAYFLQTPSYWASITDRSAGIALQNVNAKKLETIQFPLAPRSEQQRIVVKLDELLSDLDAGVSALKRARANLKRYRGAVLKAAVEGRLTEKWRAGHPKVEPASKLLERILAERRKKWEEAQLKKYVEKGQSPPKGWKEKYPEPVKPQLDGLCELPAGWCWASVDQVSHSIRYGTSAKTSEGNAGVPVIRMGNIRDGSLNFDSVKVLPVEHEEFPDLLLEPGDVLFNRTNSLELVGKTAVYRGVPNPCSYASYLIGVRPVSGWISETLAFFLNSSFGRAWVMSVASQQVGQANVNGTKLASLAFPLAPALEQVELVRAVEQQVSSAQQAAKDAAALLVRASALRQAILKRAFEGKLVPQDPNDEPARELLARIRAARAREGKAKGRARRIRGSVAR